MSYNETQACDNYSMGEQLAKSIAGAALRAPTYRETLQQQLDKSKAEQARLEELLAIFDNNPQLERALTLIGMRLY